MLLGQPAATERAESRHAFRCAPQHRFTRTVLHALFDSEAADGFSATITLWLGENAFNFSLADGRLQLARGEGGGSATATLHTDPSTLAAILYGGRPLKDAIRTGDVTIGGDASAAQRFIQLFPLPH